MSEHYEVMVQDDESALAGVKDHSSDLVLCDESTLRSLAEAERRRWYDLLQQAPTMIAVLRGSNHVFEVANEAFLHAMGRAEASSLVGQLIREAMPEIAGQRFLELLDHVYQNGEPLAANDCPVKFDRCCEGTHGEKFFNFVCQPLRNAGGQVDGIVVHGVEITEQVRERRRAAESGRQLDAIFHLATVGISQTDLTGRFMVVNQRFCHTVGRTSDELLKLRRQNIIHPDDLDRYGPLFERLVRDGEPFDIEKRYIRPDGSIIWVLTSMTVVRDEHGRSQYFLAVTQDITERKQAEEELHRVNEELQQFSYAISHDLQEPLRMVETFTQVLLRKYQGQLDEEASVLAGYIIQGTMRMQTLLHDLLVYAMVGANTDEPARSVDLGLLLGKVKQNLKSAIDENRVSIRSGPLPVVSGQEAHFVQLFQNLINNAIKYRSEAPPEIDIEVQRRGKQWLFSVRDNGIGIEPEYHETIFDAFKRLAGRRIPGTGMGLAICKRIVERLGGRLWVESTLGNGAVFKFLLPVVNEKVG